VADLKRANLHRKWSTTISKAASTPNFCERGFPCVNQSGGVGGFETGPGGKQSFFHASARVKTIRKVPRLPDAHTRKIIPKVPSAYFTSPCPRARVKTFAKVTLSAHAAPGVQPVFLNQALSQTSSRPYRDKMTSRSSSRLVLVFAPLARLNATRTVALDTSQNAVLRSPCPAILLC